MKQYKWITALVFCVSVGLPAQQITIRVGTLLDGKGATLHNTTLVIEGSKIIKIDPSIRKTTYDFSSLTVMPGWIDTHAHIANHFDRKTHRISVAPDETPQEAILAEEENAYLTMMGGFTTVQSPGSPLDKYIRDFEGDPIPVPRILTSMGAIHDGTPEEIRAKVRQFVADGADFIKLFDTKSIREGGAPTMNQDQVDAACGEAKKLGKRVIVHAQGPEGAKMAVLAGCTSIEHGNRLTDEVLDLMVQHGTYYDPNWGILLHNYIENKEHYLGVGNYNEEGFMYLQKGIPVGIDTFHRAMAKHVKIIFGTDAMPGTHGRNAEEMIFRVRDGGQPAMDAIVGATSLAAESINLQNQIGSIAPGMEADIIATDGNPATDITNVRRVVFVMKAGRVYKNIHLAPGETSIVLGPNAR
ncbi:amidohydrolase family protein [Granulicella sp. dw_53]|uniref:amidohydrolase family protein n=1 Tax=Granulicella sp. dw_53 TaxID=2719792 RepID=UPI001BD52317|nr:amidohydrolase family protein [Granulicella sp. dw_53]